MGLSFLKLLPVIAAIALVAGSFFYGVSVGKSKQKIVYQDKIIEGVKDREKIEHENKGLDHSRIVERLDDGGWLRQE